jgi:hypothetical protein
VVGYVGRRLGVVLKANVISFMYSSFLPSNCSLVVFGAIGWGESELHVMHRGSMKLGNIGVFSLVANDQFDGLLQIF